MSKQLGKTSRHPLTAGLLAGLLCAGIAPALAQQGPPNFSASNMGWVSVGGEWTRVPGSPPPVGQDPAHRYVPNNVGELTGSSLKSSSGRRPCSSVEEAQSGNHPAPSQIFCLMCFPILQRPGRKSRKKPQRGGEATMGRRRTYPGFIDRLRLCFHRFWNE